MGQNKLLKICCWILPTISGVLLFLISYDVIWNWFTELFSFVVPLLILGNFSLFFIALVFTRKFKYMFIPLWTIAISVKPISETVAFHSRIEGESDFTVMSYNIATFNPNRMQNKNNDSLFNASIYQWLRDNKSPDILCLQEFYHSDLNDYASSLDSIIKLGGYHYFYMNPVYKDEFKGVFGVITFAKFPALKSGEIKYGESAMNKGTYHDFKIKEDTIRVLNFHLNSMSIRLNMDDSLSFFDKISYNGKNIYNKLQKGYNQRNLELDEINKFIDNSPYKIVICADINSIPYSYTYQRLKARFSNAFEHAGWGFGYTCNRFPWFVRIDNQFYDKRLQIDYFTTHSEMKNSDHFPIEAGYSFK